MQVYTTMYTQEGNWPNPRSVSFLIGGEVRSVDIKNLHSDVECGVPGADLYGCRYQNDIVFDLPIEVFEEAQRLKTEGKTKFTYRIANQKTKNLDRFFHVNEVLGFEEKLKTVREIL